MSVSRLQITYKSPEVDVELDEKILEFFSNLNFVCIKREYSPILFRRYIAFEMHSKDIGKEVDKSTKKEVKVSNAK